MSPGLTHEARVEMLEALASLSGHTSDVVRLPGVLPDVLRRSPTRSRIFIADAKDAERPDDVASQRRLWRYVHLARVAANAGIEVRVLVACPSLVEGRGWLEVLAAAAGETVMRSGVQAIDADTCIAWLLLKSG